MAKANVREEMSSRVPRSLSDKDFKRFSELIQGRCGIKLPPTKKTMLEARLQKRLRCLKLNTFSDYCGLVFDGKGLEEELPHLLDVVTTNTTDFFREPKHFELLYEKILPQWHRENGSRREFMIWSAGCSSGEEPYTLAIVLSEYAKIAPDFRSFILATDISNRVLELASKAVYNEEKIAKVPLHIKREYFLRSRDRVRRQVRLVPEIRKQIHFRRLNFLEDFGFREQMDIIFCRNVMIYFERPTQEMLLNKFCRHLLPGGYLFIGHSESLTGMRLPLKQKAPTVYQRL